MGIRCIILLCLLSIAAAFCAGRAEAGKVQTVTLMQDVTIAAGATATSATVDFGADHLGPSGFFGYGLRVVSGTGNAELARKEDMGQGLATPVGAVAIVSGATATGGPDGNGIYNGTLSMNLASRVQFSVKNNGASAIVVRLSITLN